MVYSVFFGVASMAKRRDLDERTRYVLADRDGTIIVDKHYLSDPEQIQLMPGAVEGLRGLQALGLGLIVVTNQSGIGRRYFSVECLNSVNSRLSQILADEGVRLAGVFFCPHLPEDGCECRKPASGLVERAARILDFVPGESFVFGDRESDIGLAKAIGATSFLIRSPNAKQSDFHQDYTIMDFTEAVPIVSRILD